MTHIYVEHARLENGARQLARHKATFDDVLLQLESDLAPMVSTWSGEARDLYLAKKHAWDVAARDLTAVLAEISRITGEAHTAYSRSVASVKEAWT